MGRVLTGGGEGGGREVKTKAGESGRVPTWGVGRRGPKNKNKRRGRLGRFLTGGGEDGKDTH